MTEFPKFIDVFKAFEVDYLTNVKVHIKKQDPFSRSKWLIMDDNHVLGVVNVGEELKEFLSVPPEGWKTTSYQKLIDKDYKMLRPYPMIERRRYKQLDYIIRFYDPNFFRSKRRRENTKILYIDENHPITVWINEDDLAVFIAPLIQAGGIK